MIWIWRVIVGCPACSFRSILFPAIFSSFIAMVTGASIACWGVFQAWQKISGSGVIFISRSINFMHYMRSCFMVFLIDGWLRQEACSMWACAKRKGDFSSVPAEAAEGSDWKHKTSFSCNRMGLSEIWIWGLDNFFGFFGFRICFEMCSGCGLEEWRFILIQELFQAVF